MSARAMKSKTLSLSMSGGRVGAPLAMPRTPAGMVSEEDQRAAYTEFLKQFGWSHFATFTAATSSDDRLLHRLPQAIRQLERVAQGPVRAFWVRERGACGTPHLHVLLTGTAGIACERIDRAWRIGRADVEIYDPTRGAVFYLTKSLMEPDARWDLSSKLPGRVTNHAPILDLDDPDPEFPLLRELREQGIALGAEGGML
jgi:hypothetical protein